jgi:uncharacterized membrane protein (UPF0127 family)
MQVINRTRGQTLIERAVVARTAEERRRGLIGRASLTRGEGLVLPGTKSIHTFGMHFAIDVLFLDSEGCAVHLIEKIKRSRVSPMVWRSAMVLEMSPGLLAQTGTELGDRIELVGGDENPVPEISNENASRSPDEKMA